MRVSTAGIVVAAVVLSLTGGAAAATEPQPSTLRVDEVLAEATVTTTELAVTGVDPSALDTLAVPETGSSDVLGAVAAADAAQDLAVLTDQEATGDFDVLGLTWSDESAPVDRVLVRTRSDGSWSDWTEVAVDVEGPDPGTAEAAHARPGTEPLVAAGSDGIQVRVETADGLEPDGLAVTLVDGGAESAPGVATSSWVTSSGLAVRSVVSDSVPLASPTAAPSADALRPRIVTRAQWGADESIRRPIDWNDTIRAAVVHHTVNANDYSQAEAPAIVRSIYAYHVKGRGWSDVGYHFLVDRFGTVYEGRKGSLDAVPLGVHTGGFNTDTIGVSAIGDYTKVEPSAPLLDGIAQVIAWKLAAFGRDPLGTTQSVAGPGSTKPAPGSTTTFNVISGHKDLGLTACPGQYLYRQLGTIRSKVSALMVPVTSRPVSEYAWPGQVLAAASWAGTGTVSWTMTVRPFCSDTVVRELSGSGTRWASMTWDGTTGTGVQAAPGLYRLDVVRTVAGATYRDQELVVELLPGPTSALGSCGVYRMGGADRGATAVALGRQAFPTGSAVVIVAADQASVVDGLVAAPLARAKGAPILLSGADRLPDATIAEIQRRGARTAWVIGGEGVISASVVAELRSLGLTTVTRLGGADRFATANAVAAAVGPAAGVVVASGANANLIDAAAVGGAAAASGWPVLLVMGDGLTTDTADVLDQIAPTSVVAVGGVGAVSPAALADIGRVAGRPVTRLGGPDRFATALAVADHFAGAIGTSRVLVASAGNDHLIDSLTGGVLGWLTVLVPGQESWPATEAWLSGHAVTGIGFAGGPGAVSVAAAGALRGTW